jgi:multiple sugar transport system permease protein
MVQQSLLFRVQRTFFRQKLANKLVIWGTLTVLLVLALFPLYWIIITSFKFDTEIYIKNPTFFPQKFTLQGYDALFNELGFLGYLKNSLLVSVIVSSGSIFISMLAAYGIARLRFNARAATSRTIFYAYLMPKTVMYIPLYMVTAQLGVTNTIKGLILIYPTVIIPYATWMLITYFKNIPMEIEESAIIDGCSRVGSMFRIVFPLASPGIIATLIFSFTFCWNEYLYALVLITKNAEKTIPLGLSDLVVDDLFNWGPLMGGSFIASIPVVILYAFASRFVTAGLTAGSVKQ